MTKIRKRQALVNENPGKVQKNRKYVMRITGDEPEGKAELDNFIDPESTYPVIATTSKLMSTGVDALLDKYADGGIENLEDKAVLKVPPLNTVGTPLEILRLFGGKSGYDAAVRELAMALYT
jgi:type I site-specific restriction endonuclease